MDKAQLFHGDSREVLKSLPDASIDACVTDPPYALVSIIKRFGKESAAPAKGNDAYERASRGFMGKTWDTGETAFAVEFWAEVMRVLKPGGYVIAASGTRTYHRLAVAIEDAGFEIRDMISWLYGSGFPKSLDVSKAIDKAAGAKREIVGPNKFAHLNGADNLNCYGAASRPDATAPATPDAIKWNGWGTALKPACEPWVLARKPLGQLDTNVLDMVEMELRLNGLTGDIVWKQDRAKDAARISPTKNSLSTEARQAEETSAKSAGGSATVKSAPRIQNPIGGPGTSGHMQIQELHEGIPETTISDCAPQSSPPTEESANAAEKVKNASSPSTILMEGEVSTEGEFTEKFTHSCAEKNTPRAIECFAGIATGLTGSMAHVRILRDSDGSFVWPSGLPTLVRGKSLTVAQNVLAHGTGAINVDGCRVGESGATKRSAQTGYAESGWRTGHEVVPLDMGRFPANVIHDGSGEVADAFGEAHRFFYSAKASKADRNEGMEHLEAKPAGEMQGRNDGSLGSVTMNQNVHPTVKPVDLMRYLCRLVTQPGGVVLDPFMGSGSTGKAALAEGFRFIGIEREAEYFEIAQKRVAEPCELIERKAMREAEKVGQFRLFGGE